MTKSNDQAMTSIPAPTAPAVDGGRDAAGRFIAGNRAGRGNPHARRVARLRSALLQEVGPDDLRAVIRAMLDAAKGGDVAAAGLLLQHTLGRPMVAVAVQADTASVKMYGVGAPVEAV